MAAWAQAAMLYAVAGSRHGVAESVHTAPLMLFDPAAHGCPIVDVSNGLCDLLRRNKNDLVGWTYSDLLQGLPQWAISRSGRENFESFCSACRRDKVIQVGETSIVQALQRAGCQHAPARGHCTSV